MTWLTPHRKRLLAYVLVVLALLFVVFRLENLVNDFQESNQHEANVICETGAENRAILRLDKEDLINRSIEATKNSPNLTPEEKAENLQLLSNYRADVFKFLTPLPDCEHKSYSEIEEEVRATLPEPAI